VDDDTGGTLKRAPSVALGPGGDPFVVWEDWRDGEPHVMLSGSSDLGASFDDDVQVDGPGSAPAQQPQPDLALDPAGTIAVVWKDTTDGNHTYCAASDDGGASFGDAVQVDDKKHPQFSWQRDPMDLEVAHPTITVGLDRVAGEQAFFVLWEDCRDDPLTGDGWPEDHDIYLDMAPVSANVAPTASGLFSDPLIDGLGVHLEWEVCPDPDFARYELHRSMTSPFSPTSSTLIFTSGQRSLVNDTDPGPVPARRITTGSAPTTSEGCTPTLLL
jgi:hypothetical protein